MRPRLDKLRRDPARFFADARSPLLRGVGALLAPVIERPLVREALRDPLEAARRSERPLLARLAGRLESRAGRRRRARIRAHGEPRVSVIMAARDAEETVERAARSILEQTYPAIELIVVDDASADRTPEILAGLADFDPRVRVLRNAVARGAAGARNVGLRAATGAFVTFQDADDVSRPARLERQLAELLAHPEAVMSVCHYRRVDAAGRTVRVNGESVRRSMLSMLLRRAALERVGYLRPLETGEDAEYYGRVKAAFGPRAERVLFATLYDAGFAPRSLLFREGETRLGEARDVRFTPSEASRARDAEWRLEHARIARGEASPYVAFDELCARDAG